MDDDRLSERRREPVFALERQVDVVDDERLAADVDPSVPAGQVSDLASQRIILSALLAVKTTVVWVG